LFDQESWIKGNPIWIYQFIQSLKFYALLDESLIYIEFARNKPMAFELHVVKLFVVLGGAIELRMILL